MLKWILKILRVVLEGDKMLRNLMLKKISVILIALTVIVSIEGFMASDNKDNNYENSTDIQAQFTEVLLNEDEIIEGAELIVKGDLIEKKEQKVKKVKDKNNVELEVAYNVYTLQINEYLKGSNKEKLDLVFAFHSPDDIVMGERVTHQWILAEGTVVGICFTDLMINIQ